MGQFLLNGSLAPCKKTGKFLQAVLQKNYRQIDEPTKEPRKFHRTLSLSKQILRWIGYIYKIDYFRCIITLILLTVIYTLQWVFLKEGGKNLFLLFFPRNYMFQRSSKYSNTVPRRIKSCTKTQSKQYIKLKFHNLKL